MSEGLRAGPGAIPWRMELARKGIHLLPLSVPIAYGYDLIRYPVIVRIFVATATALIALDLLRLKSPSLSRAFSRIFGRLIRSHERRSPTASSFLLISFVFSLLVFPRPICVAVMYFTVVGDLAASLVGRRWGGTRLGGRRSLEGSAACLVACLATGFSVPGLSSLLVFTGAAAATLAEGTSNRIDDNLTIPIVSGSAMMAGGWLAGLLQI